MVESILATLPVEIDSEDDWLGFENKWGKYLEGESRPFPTHEEIYERTVIGLQQRGQVQDDWLPAVYSILDAGESMVGGMFGSPMRFLHRLRGATFSKSEPVVPDYSKLNSISFSLDNGWVKRFLSIQDYFKEHTGGRFAQHPCLTMDALNFAVEMREATQAYIDLYEHPHELRKLMEIGLDFNIRFQEAQMERIVNLEGGFLFGSLGGHLSQEQSH